MNLTSVTQVLDTRDLDQARDVIGAGYCEHELSVSPSSGPFHARQTEWRVGRVRVHRLTYGADVGIEAAPLSASVLISSPLQGTLRVTTPGQDRRYGPGQVVVIGPDDPFSLHWEGDCVLQTIQLDRSLIRRVDSGHVEGGLRAQDAATPATAQIWRQLTRLIEAQAIASPRSESVIDHLESLVATTLESHHTPIANTTWRPRQASRSVQAALDYIEAHADGPLSPSDIAAAANISIRACQYAIRRQTGMTPSELIRSVRLDRAHADLVAADPTVASVAQIAHRWGFGNLGRFSRSYSERFGQLPSQTLRDG